MGFAYGNGKPKKKKFLKELLFKKEMFFHSKG